MEEWKFDFESTRKLFGQRINDFLYEVTDEDLKTLFPLISGSEADKKLAVDQAFRDKLQEFVDAQDTKHTERYTDLLMLVSESAKSDLCSTSTLFIMLSDLFDTMTLDLCDEVFGFVEERVYLWKDDIFYNAGKNYLLRMCNDLLRRLSRSQNTVFCGRIQLFLARLFPLEEKSGLNLMSQFNLENLTVFNTKPEDYDKSLKTNAVEKEASMEVEEGEMEEISGQIPIDYNLYRKFWALQDFFRKPVQCYEKVAFKTFVSYSDDVLNCFLSYKLDDTKTTQRKMEQLMETSSSSSTPTYFAKYLTSEKLLDLQLSDSNFRRYVLLQFLILFQYLNAQVRFKNTVQTLTDEQSTWVRDTTEKVFKILRETPPDGDQFGHTIEHILSREENWNSWKNDGCTNYIRKDEDPKAKVGLGRNRKRCFGDDLKAKSGKLIKMGNTELTRLWNLNHDNMAAALSEKRNFLPTLESFFEPAIEQADPAGGIEEQYKLVNNPTYGWKALRLLARKNPKFFGEPTSNYWANQPKTVPQFVAGAVTKMAKELQPAGYASNESAAENTTTVDDMKQSEMDDGTMENGTNEDNLNGKEDTTPVHDDEVVDDDDTSLPTKVMPAELQQLADKIAENWKKLALELGFQEDDIIYFENIDPNLSEQASKMLAVWRDNECDKATVTALRIALIEIGELAVAVEIFGVKDDSL